MGGWRELLAPTEIIDLIRYIRKLPGPLPAGMRPGDLDVLVGKEIYGHYCVGCHGEHGNAETPLGRQLHPHPRNFTSPIEMESKDDQVLTQSIVRGIHGTAMAPWEGVLNKEDVRRVIVFIRQSFVPARLEPPQKTR
jgi:mono/diheme cytochrome c family protein